MRRSAATLKRTEAEKTFPFFPEGRSLALAVEGNAVDDSDFRNWLFALSNGLNPDARPPMGSIDPLPEPDDELRDPFAKFRERIALEHALGHELSSDSELLSKSSDDGWDESLTTDGGPLEKRHSLSSSAQLSLQKIHRIFVPLGPDVADEALQVARRALAAA